MVNHYLTNLNIGNTDMKLYDRMLLLKRAVIVACNPDTESVQIVYTDKNKSITSNHIASDVDHMKKLYIEHMVSMFTDNTKNAESLHNICLTFMQRLQTQWNNNHPDDILTLVSKKEPLTKNQLRVKNIVNGKLNDRTAIKIILLNLEKEFVELYGDKLAPYELKYDQFYADMDIIFYKNNKQLHDPFFALNVNEYSCARVMFLCRKNGTMPDHTFNAMPLYYKSKILQKYFRTF